MTEQPIEDTHNLMDLASEIVAAYVSHNALSRSDLPKLIGDIHGALKGLNAPPVIAENQMPAPAVSIRKSITPDYLICLEDGKKFKTLRRHLLQLGMTPEQYREKWNLPYDYTMVAPNYSAIRSALAINFGLGRKAAVPVSGKRRKAAAKV